MRKDLVHLRVMLNSENQTPLQLSRDDMHELERDCKRILAVNRERGVENAKTKRYEEILSNLQTALANDETEFWL